MGSLNQQVQQEDQEKVSPTQIGIAKFFEIK